MIKLALVDDHAIMLDGLSGILRAEEGLKVLGAFTKADQLFSLLQSEPIDLVILDLNMPGIDGFDILAHLKDKHPNVKSLVLTMLNDGPTIRKITELGANGYIAKDAPKHQVIKAIKEVHAWGTYLEDASSQKMVAAYKAQNDKAFKEQKLPDISKREKEVIKCILAKMKNEKIAKTLFISENTVRSHKKNIFRKFDVGNTSELIIEIHSLGIEF